MKCAHCGANLKLTDEYCPYCGRKNTQSSQHVKEKKYYEKDSTDTREKVQTQSIPEFFGTAGAGNRNPYIGSAGDRSSVCHFLCG